MKISHLTFSRSGGAGIVAKRLSEYQKQQGLESEFITKIDFDLKSSKFQRPELLIPSVIDKYMIGHWKNKSLFSILRDTVGEREKLIDPNILHLHWTPGVFPHTFIQTRLANNLKTVWTLHDMWAFTGGCHHSNSCVGFESQCRACPQVNSLFHFLPPIVIKKKMRILANAESLRVVSPSNWLKDLAVRSAVFKDIPISVIGNPIDTNFFQPVSPNSFIELRKKLGITQNDFVISFSAANLDDPAKGVRDIITAVDRVPTHKFKNERITLVGIGSGGKTLNTKNKVKILTTGNISSDAVKDFLSISNLFVHMSIAENLPNVILEAMSVGLPVICRNIGGMRELVSNNKNGYLVNNVSELSAAIMHLMNSPNLRQEFGVNGRKQTVDNYSNSVIYNKYLAVYKDLAGT